MAPLSLRASLLLGAASVAAGDDGSMCGNYTLGLSNTLKNVLILGDSISMAVPYTPGGYGVNVQQLLAPHGVSVQHAGGWYSGGQCSNTVKGLSCYPFYLNFTGTFDVISFNYGLHDLVGPCNTSPECSEHVDIPVYQNNLVTIFNALRVRTKAIMYTTTTPVPNVTDPVLFRSYTKAVAYNRAAVTALTQAAAKAGIKLYINDLWQAVIGVCGPWYTSCDLQIPANVHFEPKGQAFLGNVTATAILKALADSDGAAEQPAADATVA